MHLIKLNLTNLLNACNTKHPVILRVFNKCKIYGYTADMKQIKDIFIAVVDSFSIYA